LLTGGGLFGDDDDDDDEVDDALFGGAKAAPSKTKSKTDSPKASPAAARKKAVAEDSPKSSPATKKKGAVQLPFLYSFFAHHCDPHYRIAVGLCVRLTWRNLQPSELLIGTRAAPSTTSASPLFL
jgi:hypothetical protein